MADPTTRPTTPGNAPAAVGVFGKMKGGFQAFGQGVQELGKNVHGTLTAATSVIANKMGELDIGIDADCGDKYGALWEPNENVAACRQCRGTFVAPLRTKHHCRSCAGVFCGECVPGSNIDYSSVTRGAAQFCETKEATVKICGGCSRGECPGRAIKEKVLTALVEASKKKVKRTNNLAAVREKAAASSQTTSAGATYHETAAQAELKKQEAAKLAANPRAKTGIEKLATSIGDSLGVLAPGDDVNSIPVELTRGNMYGGGKGDTPPVAGYFELVNKSREMCCIKLLVRGGNPLFEVPRPSYLVVPPGEVVSAEFDGLQEQMELLVLHNNPSAYSSSSALVFDTRTKGFGGTHTSPDRISTCAQVGQFLDWKGYKINAKGANCLLKYKGAGIVECRRGDSMGRIGLLAKLAGKRWVQGEIDYNTNIASINEIKI